MPAMLDDPLSPTIYRSSGPPPFPTPHTSLPMDIYPRPVTLRDRITVATILPFSSPHQVPPTLLTYLSNQLNKEIQNGDTYPFIETMPPGQFANYWFANFGAVMVLGNIENVESILDDNGEKDWSRECLGSFYIKPNYPGRSSHICNAGFLVTDAARNRGVGRLMGESYLEWAPRLGYTYSVFNLVYETNVASCRIWDALGFKRIGRVKGAGYLKSYPGQPIDAIIYGRDLGPEGEDFVSEERFDKIKFYLKYGKYPAGADRAEKSRLRSAATHYKLLPEGDKLMLKDKEVISDPQKQYEIARNVHVLQHGGINKTTATIAEKYHWVRIKETVSLVIRNCTQCRETGKAPAVLRADGVIRPAPRNPPLTSPSLRGNTQEETSQHQTFKPEPSTQNTSTNDYNNPPPPPHHTPGQGSVSPQVLNRTLPTSSASSTSHRTTRSSNLNPSQHSAPVARMNSYMPLDPQIMEDVRTHLGGYNAHPSQQHPSSPHDQTQHQHQAVTDLSSPDSDSDSFQAMLDADEEQEHHGQDHDMEGAGNHNTYQTSTRGGFGSGGQGEGEEDLDMLLGDEDEEEGGEDGDGEEDGEGESDDEGGMGEEGEGDDKVQLQAEAAARAAEEALRTVGREYGRR